MIRFIEGIVFTTLAAGVHVGLWYAAPGELGSSASGDQGAHRASLVAASASQAALVEAWQTPPAVAQTIPVAQPAPDAASDPAVMTKPATPPAAKPSVQALMPPAAIQMPSVDTTPPPPPIQHAEPVPQTAPPPATRPKARPARAAAPSPAKQAAGQGQTAAKGSAGAAQTQSQTKAQSTALRAEWGARIHRKIQRNMIFPRGASAGGTAKLALVVSRSGQLRAVRLIRSSGDADIDQAAMRAVKRAGRFDAAPKGLGDDAYDFSLSLSFLR